MTASEDDNWLESEVLDCAHCGARLFAVVHSPFYDSERLYCDCCPRAVEIGFYDPEYQKQPLCEARLRRCDCGGRFRQESPRRCFTCGSEVAEAAGKDLMPHITDKALDENYEPTPEDQAEYDRWEAAFIRQTDFWELN